MKQLILVGLGGAVGAILRWQLGAAIFHHTVGWRFPLGTFVVNVLGCVVAGVLTGIVIRFDSFSADTRAFLFTGLLGGFTTFSAFGVEALSLLRRGETGVGVLYIAASVIAGLLGLWAGVTLVAGKA